MTTEQMRASDLPSVWNDPQFVRRLLVLTALTAAAVSLHSDFKLLAAAALAAAMVLHERGAQALGSALTDRER